MSDKVLLRHIALNGNKFENQHCEDVFAFRDFGTEDSEELKQEVGIECDRVIYQGFVQESQRLQIFVHRILPSQVINYVFSTKDDMHCQHNSTTTYFDVRRNYYANDYNITSESLVPVDEFTALQAQFSYNMANFLCKSKGIYRGSVTREVVLLYSYSPHRHHFHSLNCTGTYAFREFRADDLADGVLKHGMYCDKTKYLELLHGHKNFHAIAYYEAAVAPVRHTLRIFNTAHYIFSSDKTMGCTTPFIIGTSNSSNLIVGYTNNKLQNVELTTEEDAITSQFGISQARAICKYNGVLPFHIEWNRAQLGNNMTNILNVTKQADDIINVVATNTTPVVGVRQYCVCPVGNYTLPASMTVSNMTYTVPVTDIMDVLPTAKFDMLSSVATMLLVSPVLLIPAMLAINNLSEIFFDGLANLFTNLGRRK